jgi:hypothetical protein
LDTSLLNEFFVTLFDIRLDFEEIEFPVIQPGFTAMVNPARLTRQEIYEKIGTHFKVVPGSWLKLSGNNLRHSYPQERPVGTYAFSYLESPTPDAFTLGLSQEKVATTGMPIMLTQEYLLATGFNKFLHGEFFDLYSETILAEYWCYGGIPAGMVYGFHQHRGRNPEGHDPEGYDGLCIFNGNPGQSIRTAGPRRVVFA